MWQHGENYYRHFLWFLENNKNNGTPSIEKENTDRTAIVSVLLISVSSPDPNQHLVYDN